MLNKRKILYVTIAAMGNLWTVTYKVEKNSSGYLQGYGQLPEEYKKYLTVDFRTAKSFDFSFFVREAYPENKWDGIFGDYIPLTEAVKKWKKIGATIINEK